MKKNSKQLSFWEKIRFKHKLTFLNEKTLEDVFSIRLSWLSVFWVFGGFIVLLISLTSVVIINTPIRNYLPGYLDSEIRKEMVENALKADSLEQALAVQTSYLNNIHSILRGDNPIVALSQPDSTTNKTEPNLEKTEETAAFIKNYEEEEKYNLSMMPVSQVFPENLIFYPPAKGMVSARFDLQEKHYGVDIATHPKESVMATMKGTVIFTGFDAIAGYIIQIQHVSGFISIYKHNASLLKKQGDEVAAGEAIALAGSTGLSSGIHLHFELWYKGSPVDPEKFITF
jgi:murein DD-endopeptidase MepM/ murein hydrolase activator NlpD